MKQPFTLETNKIVIDIVERIEIYLRKGAAISCFFFLLSCSNTTSWENAEVYEDGAVESQVLYFDGGLSDSTFLLKKFYRSGNLKSTFTYRKGKLEGKAVGFYEDGGVGLLVHYRNGLRNGLEMRWTDMGTLRSKFQFEDDKIIDGSYFYDNGQPTADLVFDSLGNVVSGVYYHENGKLRSKGGFNDKDDKMKEGIWEYYHENGVLKEKGEYILGKRRGNWLYYDSLGNQTMIVPYH